MDEHARPAVIIVVFRIVDAVLEASPRKQVGYPVKLRIVVVFTGKRQIQRIRIFVLRIKRSGQFIKRRDRSFSCVLRVGVVFFVYLPVVFVFQLVVYESPRRLQLRVVVSNRVIYYLVELAGVFFTEELEHRADAVV